MTDNKLVFSFAGRHVTQKAQLLGNIGNNNVMMMMHGKKENFTCGKVCFSVMLGDCSERHRS